MTKGATADRVLGVVTALLDGIIRHCRIRKHGTAASLTAPCRPFDGLHEEFVCLRHCKR